MTEHFRNFLGTVKSRAVDCLVSWLVAPFQTVYEGEFWCLCTVTFGQNGPQLNSRPVYCLKLYGIDYHSFWGILQFCSSKIDVLRFHLPNFESGLKKWKNHEKL